MAMLAYNQMIPGPILKVNQGSNITIKATNDMKNHETTIHWHGLRITPESDGVPKEMWGMQDPMHEWDVFEYELTFPDEGMYWYHPHVREDQQQELGLAGNLWVISENDDWNPVDREEVLILDDILIEEKKIRSFDDEVTDHALMGRYGNIYLLNGQEDYKLRVQQNEIIRLYLTNVANTRTFRFAIPWAKMKRVGSDLGRYERDEWVGNIDIAPAERYIMELVFDEAWVYEIQNATPDFTDNIGMVEVVASEGRALESFDSLSSYTPISESIDPFRQYLDIEPSKKLRLSLEIHGAMAEMDHSMMMNDHHEEHGGIEWSDTMNTMNTAMTSENTTWQLIDEDSLEENMKINWKFTQGDIIKIRIFNDPDSDHPMHHPIHFHGQRFLVTNRNGVLQENLVWKDTVLVPMWEYVDILLDSSNPGKWMAHCHIAEHLSSGMMMNFEVLPSDEMQELRVVTVEARKFSFDPDIIRVKQWERVKLIIDNVDMLHGIGVPDMELFWDKEIILDTSTKGEFPFWCANFCGSGHENMTGKIIVE